MNVWNQLFKRTPTSEDIRVQLKEVEREQKKKRRDLEEQEQKKAGKIKEAVAAKKNGKQELLRDVFRELRQMEIDNGHLNNELRRLSLAKTALSSFERRMQLLERKKDRKSLQNLIVRFKESDIQKAIDKADVDDDTFNDMLEEILGEEELAATSGRAREDAGFAEFDSAIGQMAKADDPDDEDLSKYAEEINRAIKAEKAEK
jgi:hypothetical protein